MSLGNIKSDDNRLNSNLSNEKICNNNEISFMTFRNEENSFEKALIDISNIPKKSFCGQEYYTIAKNIDDYNNSEAKIDIFFRDSILNLLNKKEISLDNIDKDKESKEIKVIIEENKESSKNIEATNKEKINNYKNSNNNSNLKPEIKNKLNNKLIKKETARNLENISPNILKKELNKNHSNPILNNAKKNRNFRSQSNQYACELSENDNDYEDNSCYTRGFNYLMNPDVYNNEPIKKKRKPKKKYYEEEEEEGEIISRKIKVHNKEAKSADATKPKNKI